MSTGATLRDEGIEAVRLASRAWYEAAKRVVTFWLLSKVGDHVTGEHITEFAKARLGDPNKPQIFGALVRALVQRGVLIETGKRVAMDNPSSHGRRTDLYVVGKLHA